MAVLPMFKAAQNRVTQAGSQGFKSLEDQRQKDYAAKQEAAYAKRQQAAYAQKQQDRYAAKQQAAYAQKQQDRYAAKKAMEPVRPAVGPAQNPSLAAISRDETPQTSPTVAAISQAEAPQTSPTVSVVSKNETAPNEAIKRRYEALQSNLRAREGAQAQMEQDAINRRFASMGAGNSGAALKTSMLVRDASARREAEARNALSAAQSGEEQGAFENAAGRNLQREGLRMSAMENALGRNLQREGLKTSAIESSLGRNLQREGLRLSATEAAQERNLQREGWQFQAGQDDKMRAFQSREAQLGRSWQGRQADLARQFESEQAGLNREFQGLQGELNRRLQTRELDQLASQFEQELALNKKVSTNNMKIANEQMRLDRQGFIVSIMGDLGNFGLKTFNLI